MADLLNTMIRQQEEQVTRLGRRIYPRLASEDLYGLDDVPVLRESPAYNFVAGVLAGMQAVRSAWLQAESDWRPGPGEEESEPPCTTCS